MIKTITLENFKSFGVRQAVPLEPISVLVGPNNSGKSNLLTLARFLANAKVGGLDGAFEQEGGQDFVLHRPPTGTGNLGLGWATEAGSYWTEIAALAGGGFEAKEDQLLAAGGKDAWTAAGQMVGPKTPFLRLQQEAAQRTPGFVSICAPLVEARFVQLSIEALRKDAAVVQKPELGASGAGLAAILGYWRGAMPDRTEMLEKFVRQCVPEVRNVLVKPGDKPGHQRLWIRQDDGQEFDARHLSDGVLCFIALAVHVVAAEQGAAILVEEPELSIHPPRIHDLIELVRTVAASRRCQFIIATHSRVLVDEFRDEPDAILRFRRTPTGTHVVRASDVPALREALRSSTPGDLLQSNLFNVV